MERFRESSMNGLHGAVRSQLSIEAQRVAWESRWEPKVQEPKIKVYRVEEK